MEATTIQPKTSISVACNVSIHLKQLHMDHLCLHQHSLHSTKRHLLSSSAVIELGTRLPRSVVVFFICLGSGGMYHSLHVYSCYNIMYFQINNNKCVISKWTVYLLLKQQLWAGGNYAWNLSFGKKSWYHDISLWCPISFAFQNLKVYMKEVEIPAHFVIFGFAHILISGVAPIRKGLFNSWCNVINFVTIRSITKSDLKQM
jgi:hypothetical protein